MENTNNLCFTPKRGSNRILGERQIHIETRRSLFEKGDSDLSDISPLSRTSSEPLSPVHKSLINIVTPLRVRGINLLSPDRGVIKPCSFYGGSKSACALLDGSEMYKQIKRSLPTNSKARTSLFLDNLPRDKKRPRSSGNPNESMKQVSKKIRLQPNLSHDVRKPSKTEIRQREMLKRKKAKRELKEKKQMKKLNQGKRKYTWEIFNTNEELHKFTWRSSVVMTPPRSSKKRRLLSSNFEYLSPNKSNANTSKENCDELDESKVEENKVHDDLVQEIREGVLDMMKDDEDDEVSHEVGILLDRLGKTDDEYKLAEAAEEVKLDDVENIDPSAHEIVVENIEITTPKKEKFFSVFCATPKSIASPILDKKLTTSQKKIFGMGLDQLQLDVGQNKLKETECPECGLFFVQGNPEDMAEHEIFHYKFKDLRFNGWKNERVVRYDGACKIISVRNSDSNQWWKKATNVMEIIDSELGYPPQGPPTVQVYMYICDKFIRGVAAVSHITRAYKMLPIGSNDEVGVCSEEEYPVKCLVSRLWVDRHFRRCNIATLLLDSIRSNFTFGYILKCSDMAFSSPTDDGRKFIESYTKTKEYYVYA